MKPRFWFVVFSILAASVVSANSLRLLFLGNSHTAFNDVPNMVRSVLMTSAPDRDVAIEFIGASFLNDIWGNQSARIRIRDGKWTYVVMQGAKLSSSHKYKYDQSGCINLAKLAESSGSKVLWYAEWPRRHWNETNWIINSYQEIARASAGTIAPVPQTWDKFRTAFPTVEMWQPDGNHALLPGSYLAALVLAKQVDSDALSGRLWYPNGLSEKVALDIWSIAKGS